MVEKGKLGIRHVFPQYCLVYGNPYSQICQGQGGTAGWARLNRGGVGKIKENGITKR